MATVCGSRCCRSPTNADVLAILDRIMHRIARRLAKDAAVGDLDEDAVPDVFAQVQAEAATTWRARTSSVEHNILVRARR
jgi:hypothetical protein